MKCKICGETFVKDLWKLSEGSWRFHVGQSLHEESTDMELLLKLMNFI